MSAYPRPLCSRPDIICLYRLKNIKDPSLRTFVNVLMAKCKVDFCLLPFKSYLHRRLQCLMWNGGAWENDEIQKLPLQRLSARQNKQQIIAIAGIIRSSSAYQLVPFQQISTCMGQYLIYPSRHYWANANKAIMKLNITSLFLTWLKLLVLCTFKYVLYLSCKRYS